jgi:phosphoglycerate dehydrogenase-like enzyme
MWCDLRVTVNVAVLDDYQRVARAYAEWDRLDGRAELTVFTDHLADPERVVERLAPFEVVVAMRERTPFPEALLERLPNLRLLVTTGMANASIDLAAARRLGVPVSGTGGVNSATAELTWGLILALARRITDEDRAVRDGGWQLTVGRDLAGATLGVLGLGRMGSQIVTVAKAFGMRVLAYSHHLTPERAAEAGAEYAELPDLLPRSDFVTVHLRLSDRTRGMLGEAELHRMRPTAYLVNTSRGPIVEEEALLRALHEGWIAGAGLDTFDLEPLPVDHPLRSAPNTVLTPHLGYVTARTYDVFFREALEDVEAYLGGAPVRVLNT